MFLWKVGGKPSMNDQWWHFRHDEHNSGRYGNDTRPPAGVKFVVKRSKKSAQITWKASGDDGINGGKVSALQVFKSNRKISLSQLGSRIKSPAIAKPNGQQKVNVKLAPNKSLYVAVLIKQLEQLCERLGVSMEPATPATANAYATIYERPLFEQRGIAAATPAAAVAAHQPPLIFNIGFWGERQHFLVIRDVAGEDLENAETSGPSWEFFGLAHAVLFLFDPLRVRDISDQLLDLVPPTNLIGGDPGDVLRKVMSLIGRGNPRIGLVLSKFDALQALSRVEQSSWGRVMANPGAAFNRDPGLVAAEYDEDDGTLLHCEVVSLLQRLHAGPMLRTLRNPVTGIAAVVAGCAAVAAYALPLKLNIIAAIAAAVAVGVLAGRAPRLRAGAGS